MNVTSVTVKQRNHGLFIYANNLEKILIQNNPNVRFYHAYFKDDNSFFVSLHQQKQSFFSQFYFLRKQTDLLLLHYDTESLFSQVNNIKLILLHIKLGLYIRLLNRPTITVVHGAFDDLKRRNVRWLGNNVFFSLLLFNNPKIAFIVHSESFKKRLQSKFHKYREHFYFTDHLIYQSLIPQKKINEHNNSTLQLTTLGFIGPWKGQKELIEVVKNVSKKNKRFKYSIIGLAVDKEYYEECISLIEAKKISHIVNIRNVFLTPEEFSENLRQSNIYLAFHTRDDQTSSGTIIHAVTSGIPTICMKNPFVYDLSRLFRNLYVVNSKKEFEKRLLKMLLQPVESKKIVGQKEVTKFNSKIVSIYQHIFNYWF